MRLVLKRREIPDHLLRFFKNIGHKPKDLINTPYYLAEAMREDGWYIRSPICWAKTSAMPESVRDRPTSAWEPIWMFAKSQRYFYDAEAVKVSSARPGDGGAFGGAKGRAYTPEPGDPNYRNGSHQAGREFYSAPSANLRNFWLLSPEPCREEHHAAFVTEIPRRCILAGTSERGACPACGAGWVRATAVSYSDAHRGMVGNQRKIITDSAVMHAGREYDKRLHRNTTTTGWQPGCSCVDAGDPIAQTVLDPFLGSGTTLLVASRLGRSGIGIELSSTYAEMARKRIQRDVGPMFPDEVAVGQAEQLSMLEAL